jgi:hypothetical protein
MGGLVNSQTVKGDLWLIDLTNGAMQCYPIQTQGEGPGPRVGHSSLLVGNAFIVFGGDTKLEDGDVLDDTLYLLNTCKHLALTIGLLLILHSVESMVSSFTERSKTCRPLWPYTKHSWFQNIHIRWSSRRILLQ